MIRPLLACLGIAAAGIVVMGIGAVITARGWIAERRRA